jgi:fructokinase
MKAVSFGEVLWDVIGGEEHLGGAPFNLAAHLAQCGTRTWMVSRVGNDDRGRRMLEQMERLAVGATFCGTDPKHPTGIVSVELDADGQPTYEIVEDVAYDYIQLEEEQLRTLMEIEPDVFCFGTLAQRSDTTRGTLRRILERLPSGVQLCYDVNLRQQLYTREWVEHSLRACTIAKMNDSEVAVLSDLLRGTRLPEREFADIVRGEYDVSVVIVTRGAKGCAVLDSDGWVELPGIAVEVADTVGAGDAFTAAFLYKHLGGAVAGEAARVANVIGAFVASRRGAIPQYTDEVRAILNGG